jgi:hypothetical protein
MPQRPPRQRLSSNALVLTGLATFRAYGTYRPKGSIAAAKQFTRLVSPALPLRLCALMKMLRGVP